MINGQCIPCIYSVSPLNRLFLLQTWKRHPIFIDFSTEVMQSLSECWTLLTCKKNTLARMKNCFYKSATIWKHRELYPYTLKGPESVFFSHSLSCYEWWGLTWTHNFLPKLEQMWNNWLFEVGVKVAVAYFSTNLTTVGGHRQSNLIKPQPPTLCLLGILFIYY